MPQRNSDRQMRKAQQDQLSSDDVTFHDVNKEADLIAKPRSTQGSLAPQGSNSLSAYGIAKLHYPSQRVAATPKANVAALAMGNGYGGGGGEEGEAWGAAAMKATVPHTTVPSASSPAPARISGIVRSGGGSAVSGIYSSSKPSYQAAMPTASADLPANSREALPLQRPALVTQPIRDSEETRRAKLYAEGAIKPYEHRADSSQTPPSSPMQSKSIRRSSDQSSVEHFALPRAAGAGAVAAPPHDDIPRTRRLPSEYGSTADNLLSSDDRALSIERRYAQPSSAATTYGGIGAAGPVEHRGTAASAFPETFSVRFHSSSSAGTGSATTQLATVAGAVAGRGFNNIGNTCYVASTIQLLLRTAFGKSLVDHARKFRSLQKPQVIEFEQEVEKIVEVEEPVDLLEDEATLTDELLYGAQGSSATSVRRVQKKIKEVEKVQETHLVSMTPLHSVLSELGAYICSRPVAGIVPSGLSPEPLKAHFTEKGFFDGQQHDAHEFLVSVIDALETEAAEARRLLLAKENGLAEDTGPTTTTAATKRKKGVSDGKFTDLARSYFQKSWVHELLTAATVTEVRCTRDSDACDHQVVTSEPCAIMGVPLPKSRKHHLAARTALPDAPPRRVRPAGTKDDPHHLSTLLANVQRVAVAHDYKCDGCGQKEQIVHKTRFLHCPEVALLHLKRFDMRFVGGHLRIDKNATIVEHSKSFELTEYRDVCVGKAAPPRWQPRDEAPLPQDTHHSFVPVARHRYELAGLVEHRGMSLFSGHYVCYFAAKADGSPAAADVVSAPNEPRCFASPAGYTWFAADDERIYRVSDAEYEGRIKSSGQSYILSYIRTAIVPISSSANAGGGVIAMENVRDEMHEPPLSEDDEAEAAAAAEAAEREKREKRRVAAAAAAAAARAKTGTIKINFSGDDEDEDIDGNSRLASDETLPRANSYELVVDDDEVEDEDDVTTPPPSQPRATSKRRRDQHEGSSKQKRYEGASECASAAAAAQRGETDQRGRLSDLVADAADESDQYLSIVRWGASLDPSILAMLERTPTMHDVDDEIEGALNAGGATAASESPVATLTTAAAAETRTRYRREPTPIPPQHTGSETEELLEDDADDGSGLKNERINYLRRRAATAASAAAPQRSVRSVRDLRAQLNSTAASEADDDDGGSNTAKVSKKSSVSAPTMTRTPSTEKSNSLSTGSQFIAPRE